MPRMTPEECPGHVWYSDLKPSVFEAAENWCVRCGEEGKPTRERLPMPKYEAGRDGRYRKVEIVDGGERL